MYCDLNCLELGQHGNHPIEAWFGVLFGQNATHIVESNVALINLYTIYVKYFVYTRNDSKYEDSSRCCDECA